MALGFARALNLAESQNALSAQGILNNLGGEGIAGDILIFSNNLKTTTLTEFGADKGNYTATHEPYFANDQIIFREVTFEPSTAISVDANAGDGTSILTIPNHNFKTGEGVIYHNNGEVAVSKPGGRWLDGDIFYVVVLTTSTIKLAATFDDAVAESPTTLTFGGSTSTGDNHTLGLSSIELPYTSPFALTYIVIPRYIVGYKPFTNGTLLYVQDNTGVKQYYKVKESNAVDRFRLYKYDTTQPDGYGTLATWKEFNYLNDKTFYREEPVRFEAMTNLSKDRPQLNDGSSPYRDLLANSADSRDPSKQKTFLKRESLNTRDGEIDIAINTFYNKESKSIASYKKTVLNKTLEIFDRTLISNDEVYELGVGGINDDTMPGLYIMADGLKERAFSSLKNPWAISTETVTHHGSLTVLRTVNDDGSVNNDQNADVFNLIFEGPNPSLVLNSTSVKNSTAGSGFSVRDNWTHKVEIEVDGETYYLLLLDNDVATANNLLT